MADTKPEQLKAAPKKLYRFTYPYPCLYDGYQQLSGWVAFGQIVEWPDGPPDPNWGPVQADEKPQAAPASAQKAEE